MSKEDKIVFCTGGGCTAKLGAGVLSRILEKLPRGEKDPDLLVGYDSRDDAAVYRITDNIALVQTMDFFPPMVDDPYTFGQIAATNALSDVYAMGGEVKTALNLVCFPEDMDLNVLGEILRGGAEKVAEAGGSLAGGHSIADSGVKYGLSVTGLVDPHRMYTNDTGVPGDKLVLTKALGVGLLCTANRVGEAAPEEMEAAIRSMTTLNKTAAEISRKYRPCRYGCDWLQLSRPSARDDGRQAFLHHPCKCRAGVAGRRKGSRCVFVHRRRAAQPQPYRAIRPV